MMVAGSKRLGAVVVHRKMNDIQINLVTEAHIPRLVLP